MPSFDRTAYLTSIMSQMGFSRDVVGNPLLFSSLIVNMYDFPCSLTWDLNHMLTCALRSGM